MSQMRYTESYPAADQHVFIVCDGLGAISFYHNLHEAQFEVMHFEPETVWIEHFKPNEVIPEDYLLDLGMAEIAETF